MCENLRHTMGTYFTSGQIVELYRQGYTIEFIANSYAGKKTGMEKNKARAMVEKVIYQYYMASRAYENYMANRAGSNAEAAEDFGQ